MTNTSSVVDLIRGEGPERREAFMADVFQEAFGELAARDAAAAFRGKFRKMASSLNAVSASGARGSRRRVRPAVRRSRARRPSDLHRRFPQPSGDEPLTTLLGLTVVSEPRPGPCTFRSGRAMLTP
jgi:hypothetical protein